MISQPSSRTSQFSAVSVWSTSARRSEPLPTPATVSLLSLSPHSSSPAHFAEMASSSTAPAPTLSAAGELSCSFCFSSLLTRFPLVQRVRRRVLILV